MALAFQARAGDVLAVALLLVAASACSSGAAVPGPGSTPPGQSCSQPSDCGCWECTCVGVSGSPGAAQLCVEGVCPTGPQACALSCGTQGAKVAKATPVDSCPARP